MGIAIAAVVATGCLHPSTDGRPPPDRGFIIDFDPSNGCPTTARRFGPSESECQDKAADCVRVPHGRPVGFSRAAGPPPGAPGAPKEFVISFTEASPLEDGTLLKLVSKGGQLNRNTLSAVPAKNVFPFRVLGPPGSGCPNLDPQIILE